MPRAATADIVHTAATDHRVVRRPGAEPTDRPARPPTAWPLADFFRPELDPADVGRGRDFAVGVYHAVTQGRPILTDALGEFAIGLLDRAVTACPADLEAREAKGLILATMGRLGPAATAYEGVLARAPRREEALAALGATYRAQGRAADAADAWRRAVAVNPWVARYRKGLVVQLADLGEWDELRPHLQRCLELDPASVEARCLWVDCLLRDRRTADAVAEYGKVRLLKPPDLPALDAWFGKRLRQPGQGGGSPPTAPGPPRP
jgi:Flp pilus assembly protein TadD